MRGIIIILLFCPFIQIKGQSSVDVESIFKMQMFLDRIYLNGMNVIKNDSCYSSFSENLVLNVSKLKKENIDYRYEFYSTDLKDIKYQKESSLITESDFFMTGYGFVSKLVLCIDHKTGKSYRIMGFNGNDFMNFLWDYKEMLNMTDDDITDKEFLKEYFVEGVDFDCLYTGLNNRKINNRYKRDKYPCLQRADDPVYIY